MQRVGPRILLIGGTYRALCTLERLLERGERVVGFVGQEGSRERDFCPEILEICDRHAIPARSANKLGEELVRWLEDRIRPELALAVGVDVAIPLAIGGNARLGLVEVIDCERKADCPGIVLRQRGQDVMVRELPESAAEDEDGDRYLMMVDEMLALVDDYLDSLAGPAATPSRQITFDPPARDDGVLERITRLPEPGEEAEALEREVADYVDADAVVALQSTADAFSVLAQALALQDGDEVVCPAVCSKAAVAALRARGAVPVFADVEPGTLTLDAERAKEAIGPRTRALLISHPFGQSASLDALYPLAAASGIEVIEDAGSSLGARFEQSRLGRSPCAAVFRLPLGPGDAACDAVFVTLPEGLRDRVRQLTKPLRLGDGAASLAREELAGRDRRLAAQRGVAARLSSELARYDAFRIPPTPEERLPSYAAYVLGVTRFARTGADDLHKLLAEAGVETRRLVLPARERDLAELPVADQAHHTSLILPTHPALTPAELDFTLDLLFDYAIG